MADESKGVLGHLPPLPRQALNNSVIGMEQAYRQRKGLPLLSDADIEALKAGVPMPWEEGGSAPAAAPASTPAPPPAATAAASAPAAPPAAGETKAGISEEVAKIVGAGKKWSRSTVAAEQARRNRKGLPPLNEEEVTALLGEPATPAAAPATPAAATAAKPAAPPSAPPSTAA